MEAQLGDAPDVPDSPDDLDPDLVERAAAELLDDESGDLEAALAHIIDEDAAATAMLLEQQIVHHHISRGDVPASTIDKAVAESDDVHDTLDNIAEVLIGNTVVEESPVVPTYDMWSEAI